MASFFPFAWQSSTPSAPTAPVVDHIPDGAAARETDDGATAGRKIEHLYVRQAETRREENSSKLFIVYRIELHGPVRIWSVWRRYSEFDALHSKLCALPHEGGPTLPPGKLPPKTYFFSTVNSAAATDERRKALEVWLRGILEARDSRWRESQAWFEFLAIPTSKSAGRAEVAASSSAARKSLGYSKAFTSESWLDEANELSALAKQVRAQLNRRDALLANGEAVQAASVSSQARSLLTTFSTRFSGLQAGLQKFAPRNDGADGDPQRSEGVKATVALVLSNGEYTRRHDMVQRLKSERDSLSKLAANTIRSAAGSSPGLAADRNALLSASSSQRHDLPFHFRAGGRNSIWGQEQPQLSPSVGGSRRVFGGLGPSTSTSASLPVETEETRQVDNGGLLQLQQRIMDQQDEHIQSFSSLLTRQKQIGLAIGNELDNQNALLTELDTDVDTTQGKLKFAQNKLKRLQK